MKCLSFWSRLRRNNIAVLALMSYLAFLPLAAFADEEGGVEKAPCGAVAQGEEATECQETLKIRDALELELNSAAAVNFSPSLKTRLTQLRKDLIDARDEKDIDQATKYSVALLSDVAQALASYQPPKLSETPAAGGNSKDPDSKSVTSHTGTIVGLSVISFILSVLAIAVGPILAKNAINDALKRAGLA